MKPPLRFEWDDENQIVELQATEALYERIEQICRLFPSTSLFDVDFQKPTAATKMLQELLREQIELFGAAGVVVNLCLVAAIAQIVQRAAELTKIEYITPAIGEAVVGVSSLGSGYDINKLETADL